VTPGDGRIIGEVVAGLLLLLEALAGIVQQVLDPRLLELRSGTEPAT